MELLKLLESEAIERGLLQPGQELDAGRVFSLVRDMPYERASSRQPETTIAEWRGTCSGKHYLLQKLFNDLGLPSKIIACTSITPVDQEEIAADILELYEAANRRFVDVHNYLLVAVPGGREMIVDATWPLSAEKYGMVVNKEFVLGEDQKLAAEPVETWVVPPGRDPQAFKDQLLKEHFTPAELEFREVVIEALSRRTRDPG
jgi:hypothetical protein